MAESVDKSFITFINTFCCVFFIKKKKYQEIGSIYRYIRNNPIPERGNCCYDYLRYFIIFLILQKCELALIPKKRKYHLF